MPCWHGTRGDQIHPEGTQLIAQALLSEAERLAATLPVLRQHHAEAPAVLEEARASGTKDQISVLEQAFRHLERVMSLRSQAVPELREEGERLLASLRAEDQAIRHQPQA